MKKNEVLTPETARAAQELARHQMIARLYADILLDMQICEIEGWDKTEYLNQLKELIGSLGTRGENTASPQEVWMWT